MGVCIVNSRQPRYIILLMWLRAVAARLSYLVLGLKTELRHPDVPSRTCVHARRHYLCAQRGLRAAAGRITRKGASTCSNGLTISRWPQGSALR